MSIENTSVVDGVGIARETGEIILSISDHLPWVHGHAEKLEAKLANYVNFLESGQILERYPDANERKKTVHVFLLNRPTQAALEYLEAAKVAVNARGIGFRYGPLPTEGYADDHS